MDPSAAGPSLASTNLGMRDPHLDVAHDGYTVLVTRLDGRLGEAEEEGLFDTDCRVLSWWRLTLDDTVPEFVSPLERAAGRWGAVIRVPTGRRVGEGEAPHLPQDLVEVRVRRRVGQGMDEELRLTNRSMAPWSGTLALELGASFEDAVQPQTPEEPRTGTASVTWDEATCEARFRYADEDGGRRVERGLTVAFSLPPEAGEPRAEVRPASRPAPLQTATEPAVRVSIPLALGPRADAGLRLRYASLVDGAWRRPPAEPLATATAREHWRDTAADAGMRISSANPALDRILEVAADDLLQLRNWDLPGDDDASWLPNAGVPSYTGVFGRDSLIAGTQSLAFGAGPLDGALRWLADTQGRGYDDSTEEQPGRMLHELRRGPLADLHRIPQHRFYGAHTTSLLFPASLLEHWRWTGDLELVRRYLPAARRALDWARRDGDRDGDGFLEYAPTAPGGLKNEAWKDSGESMRYPDGRLVHDPIAAVEEQAFHVAAIEAFAALCVAVGEDEESAEAHARARDLRRRWHEAFWMDGDGWYAFALDPDKRPVRTIASNPAHALRTGTVPVSVVGRVVDRLFAPDLFSGWGIRTLSSAHPSYNPLSYHLGSVWPFENALFVEGLRAYGADDAAERLTTAQLTAAGHFREARLPELFGGHATDELEVPTVYADSNVTQAWTASAMASLLVSMLGLRPLAPAGVLALVRPRLPAWLPWLVAHGIPVGGGSVSIRFERGPDGRTAHEVLATTTGIEVRRNDEVPGDAGPGSEVAGLLAALGSGADPRFVRALRASLLGSRGDG